MLSRPYGFASLCISSSVTFLSTITMALLISPPLMRLFSSSISSSCKKQNVRHGAISSLKSFMLGSQYRAVKVYQCGNFILHGWHGHHFDPFLFIVICDIVVDAIPCFSCILFIQTHLFNNLYKRL